MDSTLLCIFFLFDSAALWMIARLVPELSRVEMLFSVTVLAETRQSEAALSITSRYRQRIAWISVTAVVILAVAGYWRSTVGMLVISLLHLVGIALTFLSARQQAQHLAATPTTTRVASLSESSRRSNLPGGFTGQIAPFIPFVIAAAVLALRWETIPDPMIIHWNSSWQPDGWADKSIGYVFGMPILGALICAMLPVHSWAVMTWSRTVHIEGEAEAAELCRRRSVTETILAVEYLLAGVFFPLCFIPFTQTAKSSKLLSVVILGATVISSLALLIFIVVRVLPAWEKGRESETADSGEAPIGDRTSDRSWKLGLFYVNSSDPVIYVEQRFGFGYTMNLARRESWLLLVVTIAPPLLAAFILFL
jgi:uncharacterized membrane protein